MNHLPRRTRGFTLIELLLVIAGGMAVIGIGLGVYRAVQGSGASMSAQTTATQLAASIKSIFPKADYTGLSTTMLVDSGTVPTSMIGAGNKLISPWGSQIGVLATNVGSGTNNGYLLQIPDVPRDACNKLLPAIHATFVKIVVSDGTGLSTSGSDQGGEVSAIGKDPVPGPTPSGEMTVKDETVSPPVEYQASVAVRACANARNTVSLTGS